ncbi:hypothetical protein I2I05_19815 [Hymenobacter sp. BT683]|uniref:STAS/SEC14 domain-containing protein n=1 Tax=Hymenobacter jeongseonensis TaxID=2791027 RepID=A0ABS0IMQ8_9BACT|nr:hypothetical protein [Hymenobacter jeongseonensis]MBF9239650.1 hypothetical protein [Hymenobacter jeongseonensis]
MLLPPTELPSRTLSFRTDLRVLVVRWHTMVPMAAVQADYAQMLAAAQAHGLSDWLLDVRRREVAAPELSAWVNHTFYPEAVARLAPQRRRLAVLSSPALTASYRTDPGQQKEVAFALDPARPFDIALFEDEGQAMQWLRPL